MEILNIPNKLFLLKVKDLDTVTQNGVSCNNRTVSETCYFNSDKNNKTVYVSEIEFIKLKLPTVL